LGLLGAICGFLCGCGNLPEPYPPPAQRPFFEPSPEAAHLLGMGDTGAGSHFVRDISADLQANTWRWTGKRPTIRMRSASNQNLVYSIDFAIAGSTFEQTGPVTISFFVNEHLLDRVRYAAPGPQRFQKPVPAEWLQPDENATLAAEIDKVWTPPQPGGPRLGFILIALGLERQGVERK